MLRRIESIFFNLEEDIKGNIMESIMIANRGSISFGYEQLGIQFLLNQSSLEEIMRDKIKKEVDCVWTKIEEDSLLPIKCKMIVDCENDTIMFNLTGTKYFFAIKKRLLQEYLKTK